MLEWSGGPIRGAGMVGQSDSWIVGMVKIVRMVGIVREVGIVRWSEWSEWLEKSE